MKATLFSARVLRFALFAAIFILNAQLTEIFAQAATGLSVQGILKKSNGVAVDDGVYPMTFKLYTVSGTQVWTETQNSVEVSNGIYSTILGGAPGALNGVPFDEPYLLGITIGSTELAPRVPLTSAPYAMSLIGASNKFPSSGLVVADDIQVNGGVLAQSGAPGANGVDKNGYAFSNNNGNNGDKDSGLFSKGLGTVSLYVDNAEVLEATPGKVTVTGTLDVNGNLEINNLALPSGGNITYNNLNGWRLVEENYFGANAEGWKVYGPTTQPVGWNNPSSVVAANVSHFTGFAGDALVPVDNREVLKKEFNLATAGTFTQIKVRFRYYFIDTWGFGENDLGWAAFSTDAAGTSMRVGWTRPGVQLDAADDLNTTEFRTANNFAANANVPDQWEDVEMTAKLSGGSFWLFIGAALDQDTADENYGVGAVEIWVK